MWCVGSFVDNQGIYLDQSWLCKHLLQDLDKLIGSHIMITQHRSVWNCISTRKMENHPEWHCKHHNFHSNLAFTSVRNLIFFLFFYCFVLKLHLPLDRGWQDWSALSFQHCALCLLLKFESGICSKTPFGFHRPATYFHSLTLWLMSRSPTSLCEAEGFCFCIASLTNRSRDRKRLHTRQVNLLTSLPLTA